MMTNILCLWPGLPWAWRKGDRAALAVAIAFGYGVSFLVLGAWVWPRLLGGDDFQSTVASIGWAFVLCFWVVSVCMAYANVKEFLPHAERAEHDALLCKAQAEYLSGHWHEAERILRPMLRENPEDLEARLLFATLLRRSERHEEAEKELDILEDQDDRGAWISELLAERRLLTKELDNTKAS